MSTQDDKYTRRLLAQETWWKRLLDVQRPYRRHLQRLKLGRVLDVGCGVGRNLMALGPDAVGVDHNPHSVEVARSRGMAASTPQEFLASPHAKSGTFDALLISHVIEHMTRAEAVALLKEYLPWLRPGGTVVIITPQQAGFRSDATHEEYMDFAKVACICADAGLTVSRQYSFPFPAFVGRVFKYNESVTLARRA